MAATIEVEQKHLNLALTIASGQCFRWKQLGPSEWRTVDAGSTLLAKQTETGAVIEGEASHIKSYFRLHELELSQVLLKLDPGLKDVLEKQSGLRLITPLGRAETLISFLCTPNNNLTRIKAMVDHMANLSSNEKFPSLEVLSDLAETWYRERGFGYRGATIPRAARILVNHGGDAYLEQLSNGSYEEAHKRLLELPGVGNKVADCIALYALHHTSAVPVDTHLWQAASRRYFPDWEDGSLTDLRYRRIGDFFRDKFGAYAGHAQLFLYHGNLLSKKK